MRGWRGWEEVEGEAEGSAGGRVAGVEGEGEVEMDGRKGLEG